MKRGSRVIDINRCDDFRGGRNMVLKRNLLALAIASACLGTCSVAFAANAAPTGNAASAPQTSQDQSAAPADADTATADQTRKKKEAEKATTLQAIQVK
ncbi:MAG TPA: hypothetical protein VF217_04270, partial [Rhodanobacteraceae bacterium]